MDIPFTARILKAHNQGRGASYVSAKYEWFPVVTQDHSDLPILMN